ncbi:MAG: protein TolQ [Geminicoccaceae bacterium]|nr:protein TolQ [Geminicoccaceae bacterium]MCB9945167.1 protein TolQ [Geminicoccaceae bacterium]
MLTLVLQADLVVKTVMLVLLLASLWCWAVIYQKSRALGGIRHKTGDFEESFWSGVPLDDLYHRVMKSADHPIAMIFIAGMEEWREAPKVIAGDAIDRLLQRVGRVMQLTMDRELSLLEKHVSSLATIGAVAPFVGLFGTVWGIMNSFQSIAMTKNTTLAVVAPGIAEALFATALGLLAAIPAVIAYNRISGSVDDLAGRLSSFSDELVVVIGREIDNRSRVAA